VLYWYFALNLESHCKVDQVTILGYALTIVGVVMSLLLSVVAYFLKQSFSKLDALDKLATALNTEVSNQRVSFSWFNRELERISQRLDKIEDNATRN